MVCVWRNEGKLFIIIIIPPKIAASPVQLNTDPGKPLNVKLATTPLMVTVGITVHQIKKF